MNRTRFDPAAARKAHADTILASGVLPAGMKAPFDHAWGYLAGPGEMEIHRHHKEEVYFFFEGEGYVMVDGERQAVSCGDVVEVPPDALHTVGNEADKPLLWAALWWDTKDEAEGGN